MNCSPLKDILSDEFIAFVAKRITDFKLFFVQLGFEESRPDHWIHNAHLVLETAITTGLLEWRTQPLKSQTVCDSNIEDLKTWILSALEECERNDLVDDLKSNDDIDHIIDIVSKKVTREISHLYLFLGINRERDDRKKKLEDQTRTALKSWQQEQSKKFWKYQELLNAFRERGNIKAINDIEGKFHVKECSINIDVQKPETSFPIECGAYQLPSKKRSLDIPETGDKEEPDTKKSKDERTVSTSIEPETSTSKVSTSVISGESQSTEDMDICTESNSKDQNEETLKLAEVHESCIELRDYQHELAELAVKGENTIICAGTNSGKTFIALHVIEKHLDENPKGMVAFLARTNVLLDQQYELACEKLPILKQKGKIRKWQAGQDVTSETFKNWVKRSSIIFSTPNSLLNFLEEELETCRVEINQFTLVVLDECHHTYGKSAYNKVMRHYRRLKYGNNRQPRPQILGLTASPGTNRAKNVTSAKDHLMLIMANLDVSKLSTVQKYITTYIKFSSFPEQVYITSIRRQNDPVKRLLIKAVTDVEDKLCSTKVFTFLRETRSENLLKALCNPPKDSTTVRFIQWLGETRKKIEEICTNKSSIPRLMHACVRHLEFYAECLEINELLDINDVRTNLIEGCERLEEESKKATEKEEKDLVKILKDIFENIFDLGRGIEGNPDIEKIIHFLEGKYQNLKTESRFLVFVKTRMTAKALSDKMPDYFNSRYLTGSQISKEEGGLTRDEQTDIVTRFREGKHLCVVATSVAAEGLDIPKCTVVIRYRLIPNEISSLQMRGRIRQKGGEDVMVGSQEEIEKEDINVERQFLMQEAINEVLKEDLKATISVKERNIFEMEEEERKIQKNTPNEENRGQFYVGCKKCSNTSFCIVDGQFIRRIKKTHVIVCNKAIFATIERRKTKKSVVFDDACITKTDKVFGFKCGHNWGSILIYQGCEFVALSQDYTQIIEKETQNPLSFTKWSEVATEFPLDDITDDEMIEYRSQPTPDIPQVE